jgi:hypothetical protein
LVNMQADALALIRSLEGLEATLALIQQPSV